jgi:hypothetical protein
MNYFKEVNFIFLVVGHTKNAADCLFNSLKDEYRRQNLFTFQDLVETLNKSLMVTVHPASSEDFLDYNKLMSSLIWTLAGNIKKNHIFSCNNDGSQMMLWQSNLPEHQEFVLYLWKRDTWDGMTRSKIAEYLEEVLRPIAWKGMNPYKIVELWKTTCQTFQLSIIWTSCMLSRVRRCWQKLRQKRWKDHSFRQQ